MSMGGSIRQSWVGVAVLVGIGYAVVGIVFAVPTTHVQAWRVAAWIVSAIGYAAHITYERVQLRKSHSSAALHVALAVGLAAFGLAVRANIHALSSGSTNRYPPLLALSLAIWPVMTALPAFLVALATSVVLARGLERGQGK